MSITRGYQSDELSIVVGPVLIDSGFADGEFLRIEQEEDDVIVVAGTDGETAVSRTNNRIATATVILMQTAAANEGLSALSTLARTAPNMTGGIVPFAVRDQNGTSLYTAENCWIQKPPDVSFDRGVTSREWTIGLANLVRIDGSNTPV